MKTLIPTLQFIILMLFAMCGKEEEKFTFQPNYPQPGQEITITYNPLGTSLEGVDNITLLAYCFPEGISVVHEVIMKSANGIWTGSFSSADTTLAVYIIFKSGDRQDDNNKEGYLISQYNANKKPIKSGMARQADVAFSGGTYPLRLQRDWEKAIDFYEEEFKLYPEQNQNWKMVNSYWYPFYSLQKDSATTVISARLDKLAQKEGKTSIELSVLVNWYKKMKEIRLAEKYEKEMLTREPKGYHVEFKRFMECTREMSIDKKLQLILAFVDDFPHSEYNEQLHGNMISAYTKKNQFKDAEVYVETNVKDPKSGFFDEIAWPMIKKEIRMERAVELAELAVKKTRIEQENEKKPSNYTRKQWQEKQNSYLGDILDTYGFGLYKTKKIEESVKVYAEAVELNQRKSRAICKRYSRSLFEAGQIENAYNELGLLVKKNPKEQELNAFYKEVYINYTGSENGLESFFIEANEHFQLKKQEEIKEQMMEKPAPAFALKDLDDNMGAFS